ncbi:hypothetical protein ACGFX4_18415 [Kitasatospora sp. NPDC048365]|uniref:hypothetical protein n=1 Tax=Kitasatospora sp. NPDC048365 TaxID=3364050 RepID=UPI00371DBD3B
MAGGGEPPGAGHGFLGPVEAGDGSAAPPPPPLPPTPMLTRRQKYWLAALLLALATAATVRHAAHRPDHAANSPPPPYPSQVARFSYQGPSAQDPRAFAFRLSAHNDGPVPLELLGISQGYRGLRLEVTGSLPRTLAPDGGAVLLVTLRVTDCSAAPAESSLPYLDVTLRNTRAMQTVSQILGAAYARDLSASIRLACPDSRYSDARDQ